jgi:hypothetical protein
MMYSVLRRVHSLVAKQILHRVRSSASCSNFQIFSFPYGHPEAVYTFFLVFPSPLSFNEAF